MTSSNGNLFDLTGKVALITGGNGGLGLGMALGLANAGADIAIAARNAQKNAAAVAEIEATGRSAFAIPTDVTSESDIDDMASRAVAHFGHVDILINNAGATVRKAPEDITAAEWDNVLDVNLRAAFLSARRCILTSTSRAAARSSASEACTASSVAGAAACPTRPARAGSYSWQRASRWRGPETTSSPA